MLGQAARSRNARCPPADMTAETANPTSLGTGVAHTHTHCFPVALGARLRGRISWQCLLTLANIAGCFQTYIHRDSTTSSRHQSGRDHCSTQLDQGHTHVNIQASTQRHTHLVWFSQGVSFRACWCIISRGSTCKTLYYEKTRVGKAARLATNRFSKVKRMVLLCSPSGSIMCLISL